MENYAEYTEIEPYAAVEQNNHQQRNALTPALLSVGMLQQSWQNMTPEQIAKHLTRIEMSINQQIAIIEKNNEAIASRKVILFKRQQRS